MIEQNLPLIQTYFLYKKNTIKLLFTQYDINFITMH